jgi:competence protein ComEC
MSKKKSSGIQVKVGRKKVRFPWWVVLIVVLAVAVGCLVYFLYFANKGAASGSSSGIVSSSYPKTSQSYVEGDSSPISFNFVAQGNAKTGDCVYVKAGDNDILIDAGNRPNSASVIEKYVEDKTRAGDYVSDGKLEYVIATHAHQDHIAGFYGVNSSSETSGKDGILYHYKVENLIDFSYYDSESLIVDNASPSSYDGATTVYKNYVTARKYAVSQGTKWQTAGQMWASGSKTVSLGKNLSMTLIYNYFYDHTSKDMSGLGNFSFSVQNDCSVCVLFTQGNRNFLFTGDAEAAAEYSLTKYNALPQVDLFKGGHHGSYTANTDALLSVIKPKLVCICCCAGNQEYASLSSHTFPAQESIDRISKYTDRVYVTDLGSFDDISHIEPLNGNIVAKYDEKSAETFSFSNNDFKLKDTAWFKANRTMPQSWS